MKSWIACAFVVATASLAAQAGQPMKMAITSAEDYSKTMKEIGAQSAALRKAVTSAAEPDVAASAAKLETVFKDVQAYWENKKVDDATTAAKNAVAASQAITKAVAAHDMAAVTAASTTLNAQCMACHTAHRERLPDGSFQIK